MSNLYIYYTVNMPDFSTLIVFSLAAVALIVVPGPNIIYIMTRGISGGKRAAVASALGVDTATMLHIIAATAGLSALLASSALAFNVVKYLGAVYLVYLGVKTLLSKSDQAQSSGVRGEVHLGRVYLQGIIVNALNPKVPIFFSAFLPQFIDPTKGTAAMQFLALGTLFFFLALLIDLLYAASSGAIGGWLARRPSFLRRHRYFTGSVYLALGVAAGLSDSGRQRN